VAHQLWGPASWQTDLTSRHDLLSTLCLPT